MNVSTTLEPRVQGGRVVVTLTLRNPSDGQSLEVEPRQLFQEEGSLGSLLEVSCDGKPVAYRGPMIKRAETLPEHMLMLEPGKEMTSHADITALFNFLPGQHTYTIQYEAYVTGTKTKDTLVKLYSSPEKFSFAR